MLLSTQELIIILQERLLMRKPTYAKYMYKSYKKEELSKIFNEHSVLEGRCVLVFVQSSIAQNFRFPC